MDQDPIPLILGSPYVLSGLERIIEENHPEIEITDEFFYRFFHPKDVSHTDKPWKWVGNGKWSMSLGSKTGIFRVSRDDVERVYQVMEDVPLRNTRKARWPD
jgi:hypothetical protein